MSQPTRRQAAKTTDRPKAPKTKTAVSLTDEAIKRLGAACVAHGLDQSDIVEWLIQEHLSGYVIQVRQTAIPIGKSYGQAKAIASGTHEGSASDADHVNPSAASAA